MIAGVIYVLTNPSFPEYVKIGYASDLERRLKEFNRSECLPFAFRVYCVYETTEKLKDKDVHRLIDSLNPDLRAVETFDGKPRVREFYNISAEDAYGILESIAAVSGTMDRLKRFDPNENQLADENTAAEISDGGTVSFTEKDHLERASPRTAFLYKTLKEKVCAFGDVVTEPRKLYVAFAAGSVFLSVILQRGKLKLILNMKKGSLDDPAGLTEDMSKKGHWGVGDYQVCIADEEDMDAVLPLIRQAFESAQL